MLRFGPKLEFRQAVLFRLVDVAGELFAMAATCARARLLAARDPVGGGHAVQMADLFCRQARGRVRAKVKGLWRNERSEEHTSELQSQSNLVCRLLLGKKKK